MAKAAAFVHLCTEYHVHELCWPAPPSCGWLRLPCKAAALNVKLDQCMHACHLKTLRVNCMAHCSVLITL